jgi:hypothetical protein
MWMSIALTPFGLAQCRRLVGDTGTPISEHKHHLKLCQHVRHCVGSWLEYFMSVYKRIDVGA